MKNILIVDDKLENRYMIESLLKGDEFSFMSANNGIEALDLAHNSPPDLVISDILMPVMDGFTLCKEWRQDKLLKKIPFIFYTAAYTNPEDIKYALKLGADRFLIKPQEPEEFLSEIKDVLHEFETGELKAAENLEKNELESLREYNSILFRKLEDKLFQIEMSDRKLKRYSNELEQHTEALKHSEKNLGRMQNLLDHLTEYCHIPFIVWDNEFNIIRTNTGFEIFTGYKENEVVGKNIFSLFSEGSEYLKFKEKISSDHGEPFETVFQTKSGTEKKGIWHFSFFDNREGAWRISAIILTPEHSSLRASKAQNTHVKEHPAQKIEDRTIELENSREQLRGLSSHLQKIREEERKHVAREIHDELGHLLTALKLDMEGLINQKNDHTLDNLNDKILPLVNMVDAAIDSVKTIATELRPAILDNLGLIPALNWQIQQLRIRSRIECMTEFDIQNYHFNNEESTAIFRIFQEILTNIYRHSKATKVWIIFKKERNNLILTVKDNGIGFNVDNVSKIQSFGILGMSERALSIGGHLIIESIIDIGTTVKLMINMKETR